MYVFRFHKIKFSDVVVQTSTLDPSAFCVIFGPLCTGVAGADLVQGFRKAVRIWGAVPGSTAVVIFIL